MEASRLFSWLFTKEEGLAAAAVGAVFTKEEGVAAVGAAALDG